MPYQQLFKERVRLFVKAGMPESRARRVVKEMLALGGQLASSTNDDDIETAVSE
jgi:hypothetical protein